VFFFGVFLEDRTITDDLFVFREVLSHGDNCGKV
jgi:hypothetical protein